MPLPRIWWIAVNIWCSLACRFIPSILCLHMAFSCVSRTWGFHALPYDVLKLRILGSYQTYPSLLTMNTSLSYHTDSKLLLCEVIIRTGQIWNCVPCSLNPFALLDLLYFLLDTRPIPLIPSLDTEYSPCVASEQLRGSLYLDTISVESCMLSFKQPTYCRI